MRRAASTDPVGFSKEERARELIPSYWIRQPQALATGAGMHRFVWDLRYSAPRAAKHSFPISAVPFDTPREPLGPFAVPGTYRVRLQVGARRSEESLTVLPDPRVSIAQQDYLAQFALAQDLARVLDESTTRVLQAKSLRSQLKTLKSGPGELVAARAKALDEQLEVLLQSGDSGPHRGLERLNGDIASLYEQVLAADAASTQAQRSAAQDLSRDWQALAASSARIWQEQLASLNQALTGARLPALRGDDSPSEEGEFNDEE